MLYIKNSFHSHEITFETLFEESVWCSVKLNNKDTLACRLYMYIP